MINSDGRIAFLADLQQGVGAVDASNDTGLWSVDDLAVTTLVREGVGGVPEIATAQFDQLQSFSLSNSGDILLQAKLRTGVGGITSSNRDGLWRLGTSSSLLAQTGSSAVGVPGSSFTSLGSPVFGGSVAATPSQLALSPTVNSDNNRGLWSYGLPSGSVLLARSGTTPVPGAAQATFLTFSPQSINTLGEVSSLNLLSDGSPGVTVSNRLGIWTYDSSGGMLIARQEVSSVAGVSGAQFEAFSGSSINANGDVSFGATLRHSGTINTTNDGGIWLHTGGATELLAREGSGNVPGISGASFAGFQLPQLNDLGHVIVQAELMAGSGGVDSTNNQGIWRLEGSSGSSELVARVGSSGVPEISGANFDSFTDLTFNDAGQLALSATLEVGPGGVTLDDTQGIWVFHSNGSSELIARTGDVIGGETIKSLSLSGGKALGTRPLNDAGDLVFQAEFASGGFGLFVYESPIDFSPADFNESGAVDGDDLMLWQANYGTDTGLQGDADEDDDVDGLDYLVWQQTFEGSSSQVSNVPEPSTVWLVFIVAYLKALQRPCEHHNRNN
ncbi:MAG: hypothetical protein RH917_02170 [Lacipirellulaceae bacterium]